MMRISRRFKLKEIALGLRVIAANILRDASGGILVPFAMMFPVAIAAGAYAVDLSQASNAQTRLQAIADATALSVVREMSLAGATVARLEQSASNVAKGGLGVIASEVSIAPLVDMTSKSLTVTLAQKTQSNFGSFINKGELLVSATATARLIGSQKICLLALDSSGGKSISLLKTAKLTANDCSVFANSRDSQALSSKDMALMKAQQICSGGGIEGAAANFSPFPKRDCPAMRDPLAGRSPPPVGACSYNNHIVESGTVILRPGTYCGGLKITKNAIAKLDAGIYIMKGGKLIVDSTATLEGSEVSIYLADGNSQFEFDKETTISLAAPRTGPMAGIIIFEDRQSSLGNKHMILSNNAHTLLGTIYLPRGILFIDAERPISNRSAFTIVVAHRVEMISGPELVLNADYGSTGVPVPAGVGSIAGEPRLVR